MIASLIDTRPNPPETTKSTKLKVSTPATEGYYDDDAISLLLSDALFNKLLDTRSGMRLLQCISFCLSQLFCFASFENLMLQSTNNYVLFFLVVCVFRFFADTLLIESRRFCFSMVFTASSWPYNNPKQGRMMRVEEAASASSWLTFCRCVNDRWSVRILDKSKP